MKANMRSRNLAVNSYLGALAVTVVGSLATLYIVHVAIDVPFSSFATPQAYAIDSSL
jgi:hypothetical protein